MDNINEEVRKILQKISCLIACLKCDDWVVYADENWISSIFRSACDISWTLNKDDAKKLNETLTMLYPTYDFTNSGDIVLETFLVHPRVSENMQLCAVEKYLAGHSKMQLHDLIMKLLKTKKIKLESVRLMSKFKNDELMRLLQAKSLVFVWESMIVEQSENFEKCVLETFEKETDLCVECLRYASNNTTRVVVDVIVKYLDSRQELDMWFLLLNNKNVYVTISLCCQFEPFMESLLQFLSKYASQAKEDVGNVMSWNHCIPLDTFVNVLQILLTNGDLVGIRVNDFISKEINCFGDNCSFWLDVKTLL